MAAWGTYVQTVTSRYKGTINAWEIWNEPWGTFWSVWNKATGKNVIPPDAEPSYANIAKIAYARAKQAISVLNTKLAPTGNGIRHAGDQQPPSNKFGATNDAIRCEYFMASTPFLLLPRLMLPACAAAGPVPPVSA